MNPHMGKPTICLGEDKGADELRSVTAKLISTFAFATQIEHFYFYLNPKFQDSSSFLCTGQFLSDLVRNLIVGFPTQRLVCIGSTC